MSDLPTLNIMEPIIIPATEEKNFNIPWVTQFSCTADDPANVRLYAIIRPSCVLANGTREILVQDGKCAVVDIQDLFGILQGTKIEPKLTKETIQMGGQLMGLTLMFLNAYLTDKAAPDAVVEPVVEPVNAPVVESVPEGETVQP